MADDFQTRLYALVEESITKGTGIFEAFVAKGDTAQIFDDLGKVVSTSFYDDFLRLLSDFGLGEPVPPPRRGLQRLWTEPYFSARSFTVGELKDIVRTRQWPDDAAYWRRLGIWSGLGRFAYYLIMIVGAALLLTGGAFILLRELGWV